jgi:hypothetical protein
MIFDLVFTIYLIDGTFRCWILEIFFLNLISFCRHCERMKGKKTEISALKYPVTGWDTQYSNAFNRMCMLKYEENVRSEKNRELLRVRRNFFF